MVVDRVRRAVVPHVVAAAMTSSACLVSGAQAGYAQRVAAAESRAEATNRVTVSLENAPLTLVLHLIARQAGLVPGFTDAVVPVGARVTLHLRAVSATDAFRQALRGTGLVAKLHAEGDVAIVREDGAQVGMGTITGRVTDARTKQPLRGAKIGLDGADRVGETKDDGMYQLKDVRSGAHTLTVRLIGFKKVVRTITVKDEAVTMADAALDLSATPLDQVVVTGTVVATELKAIPNAITVITARQIEERGITQIQQLFRGEVPGLFALNQGANPFFGQVTMFSRGTTALAITSSTGPFDNTNPIKTYVDGVELADPKYLSQIDPKSIERIEILTGPQASTIYGSNAINGVMQVFTKRGTTSMPQLTLNLLSGWVENNSSRALTPQHDYNAQLSGVEGRLSYNAGGSWNYMGAWTPSRRTAAIGGFGGARLSLSTTLGSVTADATLRRTRTRNLEGGSVFEQGAFPLQPGWYRPDYTGGGGTRAIDILEGQTFGLTFGYAPTNWWSHELELGQDVSGSELQFTAGRYAYPQDSSLALNQNNANRHSLRYSTTARIPVTSVAQATITLGTDTWQSMTISTSVESQSLTGTLLGTTTVMRRPEHNTGAFLQTQLGVMDRLFFTYGLRAEWNPNFGDAVQPNYAPRYGVAYTQEIGTVTAKLRGSYGSSTRPPAANQKQAIRQKDSSLLSVYGPYDVVLANPDLGPEYQKGSEGGIELYLGNRASIGVTRYNQTVDALIANAPTDSIRSLQVHPLFFGFYTCQDLLSFGITDFCSGQDANGYAYITAQRNLNIGSIRNQGWELQGSVVTGPLTTRGTYSWTKSRTIGITPKYRALFANVTQFAQYQPGATFILLPEHTWAIGATYARGKTVVALNINGVGETRVYDDKVFREFINPNIRLMDNRARSGTTNYVSFNRGYPLSDLTAQQGFSANCEAVLQIQNLMNQYTNDRSANTAVIGRQVRAGLRVRVQ